MQVFQMEIQIIPPCNITALQTHFPEIGKFAVFVVLRMRVFADESPYVHSLLGFIVERQAYCEVIVANCICNRQKFHGYNFVFMVVFLILFLRMKKFIHFSIIFSTYLVTKSLATFKSFPDKGFTPCLARCRISESFPFSIISSNMVSQFPLITCTCIGSCSLE